MKLPASASRAVDVVKRILCHLDKVRTFGLAAEMAFWVFLSLVPLAAVAGLVVAKLATSHWGAVAPHLEGLPPAIMGFVQQQLASVAAWNGGSVALPACAVFVWLAASGVQSIFDALEVQTSESRPWWKKRLLALASCVALSIGVALLGVLLAGFSLVETAVGHAVPLLAAIQASVAGKVARFAFGALIYFALIAGLFRVGIPRGKHETRMPVAPGAALTTVLQIAMGFGYGAYVSTLGKSTTYSGALWAIGVTMTALYLFAIAILLGAELNRYVRDHRPASRSSTRLTRPIDDAERPSHASLHARAR